MHITVSKDILETLIKKDLERGFSQYEELLSIMGLSQNEVYVLILDEIFINLEHGVSMTQQDIEYVSDMVAASFEDYMASAVVLTEDGEVSVGDFYTIPTYKTVVAISDYFLRCVCSQLTKKTINDLIVLFGHGAVGFNLTNMVTDKNGTNSLVFEIFQKSVPNIIAVGEAMQEIYHFISEIEEINFEVTGRDNPTLINDIFFTLPFKFNGRCEPIGIPRMLVPKFSVNGRAEAAYQRFYDLLARIIADIINSDENGGNISMVSLKTFRLKPNCMFIVEKQYGKL